MEATSTYGWEATTTTAYGWEPTATNVDYTGGDESYSSHPPDLPLDYDWSLTGRDLYGYKQGQLQYDEYGYLMTDAAGDLLGFPLTPVWKAYLALIPTFSALSIFSSMVALTVYVCMRKFSPKAANRVSLRLAALISVADIGYNSAWFTLQYSLEMGRDGPCKTAGWFLIFCGLVSVFTTFAIGLNIFLIFVLKLHSTPVFEISYNVIAITLAGLLATVSIASGRFGYNGWECWFMGKEEELKASDEYIGNAFGFYYGWILAACVCCAVFIAMFWWVLKQNQRGLQQGTGGGGGIEKESGTSAASGLANQSKARANRKMTKMINRTVGRISWYCVVPIAAQLSNVAYDFIMRAGGFDYWCILPTCVSVVWLSVLTAALQGFLNSLIFLFADPTVASARKDLRKYLVRKYYLPYLALALRMGNESTSSHVGTHSETGKRSAANNNIMSASARSGLPNHSMPDGELEKKKSVYTHPGGSSRAVLLSPTELDPHHGKKTTNNNNNNNSNNHSTSMTGGGGTSRTNLAAMPDPETGHLTRQPTTVWRRFMFWVCKAVLIKGMNLGLGHGGKVQVQDSKKALPSLLSTTESAAVGSTIKADAVAAL